MKMNMNNRSRPNLSELEQRAQMGTEKDINFLMNQLEMGSAFLLCKMIDYALGKVTSMEGRERIKYFLFHGTKIQRNYAALYFKRLGATAILREAVNNGIIDEVQAYSR
jgi:hypothetical protein